jgi:hypothetical protein
VITFTAIPTACTVDLSEQLPHRINRLAVVALEEAEVPHELVYGRVLVDELVLRSNRAIAGDFSFQALKGGYGIKALTPTLSSLSVSPSRCPATKG